MDIKALIPKRDWASGSIFGVLLIVLVLVPIIFPEFWVVRLSTVLMFTILAVGWTMFSGPTGYMSLATAAFFGTGIYIAAYTGENLPLPAFTIIAGVASFILALGVGALTLRLRGIYFAIFTFGLNELIKHLLLFFELHAMGVRGRFVIVSDYNTIFNAFLIVFVLLVLTAYFIKRSRFGLALQSIGEYEEAAAHTGINVTMVKIVTFAISAFFMGAAGAIWATKLRYVDPGIAFFYFNSFMPVLMAMFGGVGQLYGPIIGATFLTLLKEFLITTLAKWGIVELYMLIFGAVFVVAILYMPNGVAGLAQNLWNRFFGGRRAHT